MKVFVATGSGNSQLVGTARRAVDGELVWVLPNEGPCAECGCRWSVCGFASAKVAPAFTVADRSDLEPAEFKEQLVDALRRQGWPMPKGDRRPIDTLAQIHVDVASRFAVGERLSFRGGRLHRVGAEDQ